MALQLSFTNQATGQASPTAYARIQRPEFRRLEQDGTVEVYWYHDAAKATSGASTVRQTRHAFSGASLDAIIHAPLTEAEKGAGSTPYTVLYTRIYNALKTLPEFAGAADV